MSVPFGTLQSGRWVTISCRNKLPYFQSTLSTRKKKEYVDCTHQPTHLTTLSQPRLSQYKFSSWSLKCQTSDMHRLIDRIWHICTCSLVHIWCNQHLQSPTSYACLWTGNDYFMTKTRIRKIKILYYSTAEWQSKHWTQFWSVFMMNIRTWWKAGNTFCYLMGNIWTADHCCDNRALDTGWSVTVNTSSRKLPGNTWSKTQPNNEGWH